MISWCFLTRKIKVMSFEGILLMDLILKTGNNKTKCQKFTPAELVNTMLDLIEYKGCLIGKTVLENSFGSGNIIKPLVIRYIEEAIKNNIGKEEIASNLEKDIYGIELDKELYTQCVNDLNLILHKYDIPSVNWNLYNCNALKLELPVLFDFIIGNPPYISYRELDKTSRSELKEKFDTCSNGKFDYCYAFIEMSVKSLKDTGKLVQLIPNNIYKNVFAKELRNLLLTHISVIYDYPEQTLFEGTLTSSSVFLFDRSYVGKTIKYFNTTSKISKDIDKSTLGEKWAFGSIANSKTKNYLKFGDYFNASISIATLCNKAYLVDQQTIDKEGLEPDVIRPAASPKSLKYDIEKKIIFPYYYNNGNLIRYSAKEFKKKFPCVNKHLTNYGDDLSSRNSDSTALWFEYGRSQALSHINHEKLLLSTVITNTVEIYKLDSDTIPYSGIYITNKNNNYTLDDALNIIKSDSFYNYVKDIGISISGKSVRITCKDINNYMFLQENNNGRT